MISVPGFLLRRLYRKGSLQNTAEGFQFVLKNSLGSGYGKRMLPLRVDGEEMAPDATFFEVSDGRVAFSEVSEDQPFTLAMNQETVITAVGPRLAAGAHKIGLGFEVQGLGTLSFDFTDAVRDA